ncbi:MAG: PorP/SprF family type IX secretion system membrane protein [Saprospiraceae bacterium]
MQAKLFRSGIYCASGGGLLWATPPLNGAAPGYPYRQGRYFYPLSGRFGISCGVLLRILLWVAIGALPKAAATQNPHFSQSWMSPLQLNPATTGLGDWDARTGVHAKNQWASVPVAYQTFAAFYDQKIQAPRIPVKGFSVGGYFLHDRAGDSRLRWTQVSLSLAWQRTFDQQHTIALGVGMDAGQRAFRTDMLALGDQYNGEFFDPNLSSAEVWDKPNDGFVSFHVGGLYAWKAWRSRSQINAGLAAGHLNRPTIGFSEGVGTPLPMWFRLHAQGVVEATDDWDVVAQGHVFRQGQYQEGLLAVGGCYHWQRPEEVIRLGAHIGYRVGDAFIGYIDARWKNWLATLSYDVNTSPFAVATNGRGGLEFSLHRFLFQPKPPETFKSCPIF